ncbi:MAG: D-glycero-beta-D-manno-heptose-7-phosphate kinase [Burkholderiaceae bacterium]|nr:D-glycero-beta-D-manno-heptose-7-phosphate kinase [Burkholderiaceae bacterium]MCD8517980.1 D-glycero-beta-D-manno-heptose-7-phosphate kinase [Burkholderiaceae bacterium]MCD8537127.1 D-glycero-beta-D-manno-heptose-7-phosphate kinase [Burkholderiaceae bacterium]MCD8564858.1 D-glycero-beta-D-manno-heptose-7-phosphate kinase [Burkholderiaceae bacterium]
MPVFPREDVSRVRVLVVGDVMLDRYWFGEVERISPEAPVPVVHVGRREDRLGGAANVARNAAALGAKVTLAGIVGRDEPGREVHAMLEDAGISPALVDDDDAHPTTLKMRVLGRQQQMVRVDFEGRPSEGCVQALTDRAVQLMAGHDVVVLSDYDKGALAQVGVLIRKARELALPVLVDPKGLDYTRYQGASLVTPNRSEMQQAVGNWRDEDDLNARAQRLREQLALEALLVTRSEQGMTLFMQDARHHVDAQAHEVFDVSGAGDTVLATLAVVRGTGASWVDAMRWANRAGGIVVGKLGTSTVTVEELQ